MKKMIARIRAWARVAGDARLDELPLVLGFGVVADWYRLRYEEITLLYVIGVALLGFLLYALFRALSLIPAKNNAERLGVELAAVAVVVLIVRCIGK